MFFRTLNELQQGYLLQGYNIFCKDTAMIFSPPNSNLVLVFCNGKTLQLLSSRSNRSFYWLLYKPKVIWLDLDGSMSALCGNFCSVYNLRPLMLDIWGYCVIIRTHGLFGKERGTWNLNYLQISTGRIKSAYKERSDLVNETKIEAIPVRPLLFLGQVGRIVKGPGCIVQAKSATLEQ